MFLFFKEPKLRATQYLPNIVKLQQSLFDKFNYRVDKTMAKSLNIKDFLEKIQNGVLNSFLLK